MRPLTGNRSRYNPDLNYSGLHSLSQTRPVDTGRFLLTGNRSHYSSFLNYCIVAYGGEHAFVRADLGRHPVDIPGRIE